MRTQDENPAYQLFAHLLPASGLYPAAWVDIFSNTDDDTFRYKEVEVVFVPRGKAPDGTEGPNLDRGFWDAFAAYNAHWAGDLGNSVMGWMKPGGLTPEHVFGNMLATGFVDRGELRTAVEEFAHIEECDWARAILNDRLLAEVLTHPAPETEELLAALERVRGRPAWAQRIADAVRAESRF